MTDIERRTAAAKFAADWRGRGDEKQETQAFWLALLQKVYGVEEPEKYVAFEVPVKLDHTSFIDGYIESTRVLIEQKGKDIDLSRGYKQSDGAILNPFQQARRYAGYLPHDKNPRWIVVCNFQEFRIHDMNRPNDEQKAKIEQTAQAILDARALYPDSSLADLYDETFMPSELRKTHQNNDRAVMQAYGFSVKDMTESKCVAELMKLYQALTEKQ